MAYITGMKLLYIIINNCILYIHNIIKWPALWKEVQGEFQSVCDQFGHTSKLSACVPIPLKGHVQVLGVEV